MLVRDLQSSDLPALRPLLRQLGYDIDEAELARRIGSVLSAEGHRALVAEEEGRLLGLVHIFDRPSIEKPCEAHVQSLIVDEAHQGRGIGRALMAAAETAMRERGLDSVALYASIGREGAHAFYSELGFEIAATSHFLRKVDSRSDP